MRFGIWHYLSGYVIIEVKGRHLERFINRVVQSGGDIWHVKRTGTECVRACVDVATFYAMRPIVRQCGVSVSIMNKRGALITLSRFRFRKVLLFGWAVVLGLIIGASRYVWFVEVSGCDSVPPKKLIATLENMGLGVGSSKRAIGTYSLGQRLMATDERIAWAGVSIDGVVLKIDITEAENKVTKSTQHEGANSLYASKDGIITELRILDGKAVVSVGDAVTKGQELVSGVLRNDELGYITTAARGAVTAKVGYTVSAKVGPKLIKQAYSGKEAEYNAIKLFGVSIADKPEYASYSDEALCEYELSGCVVPLSIERRIRRETVEAYVDATNKELEAAAALAAEEKLIEMLPHSATILSKSTRYEYASDGTVTAIIAVTTSENIAQAGDIYGEE